MRLRLALQPAGLSADMWLMGARWPIHRSPGQAGLLWLSLWLLVAPCARLAEAGPWVQEKGHGILIWNLFAYQATERFGLDREREPLGENGRFRSLTFQGWLEVGLTNRWTWIATGSVPALSYRDRWMSESAVALGDFQTGVRRGLRNPERGWQVAVQTLIKAPAYRAGVRPRPGNGQMDWEVSLLAGRSFPVSRLWGYTAFESGYRKRWGRPDDQWRSEAAAGIHLHPRLTLSAQLFTTYSVGGFAFRESATNPLVEPNYDLVKGFATVNVGLTRSIRVQAGYGADLAGRNTGAGRTWVLGLWKNF